MSAAKRRRQAIQRRHWVNQLWCKWNGGHVLAIDVDDGWDYCSHCGIPMPGER